MTSIQTILKRPSLYYILYLLIGMSQISSVGISWDEPAMRGLGASAAKYLVTLVNPNLLQKFQDLPQFTKIQDFQSTPDGDHGVIFELGLLSVEAIFKLSSNTALLWQVRHLLTFLFCSLSIVIMFKFLHWRFGCLRISYFGTLAFVLTPRIYGDSFYNEKDSVLLTSYFAATYLLIKFLSEKSLKNSVFAGISLGFSIAIRPVSTGLVLFFLLIWFLSKIWKPSSSKVGNPLALPIFITVSTVSTFAFFPYLWQDPFGRAVRVLLTASGFPWTGRILTNGQLYDSLNLPWFYIFLWIGVTLPLLYIPFLIIGTIALPRQIYSDIHGKFQVDSTNRYFADLFIYLSALGPVAAVIVLHSTLYDGWRHLYFVYPSLLIIGVHGVSLVVLKLKRHRVTVGFIFVAILLNFLGTTAWMFENRPLHNVYFNQLAGENIREHWEMDYWGLANRKTLDFLVKYDSSPRISVFVASATPLFRSLDLLPKNQADRIEIVSDVNAAKYVFTNYRDLKIRDNSLYEGDFKILYKAMVGDANVNTLLVRTE